MIISLFGSPIRAQKNTSNDFIVEPFTKLLEKPVQIRPELNKIHPRLFFTREDLPKMRERARGVDKELWQAVLKDIKTLKTNPPDVNDEDLYKSGLAARKKETITQYELAFQISQTSFIYAIEGDEKYLEAAKK